MLARRAYTTGYTVHQYAQLVVAVMAADGVTAVRIDSVFQITDEN